MKMEYRLEEKVSGVSEAEIGVLGFWGFVLMKNDYFIKTQPQNLPFKSNLILKLP